MSDLDFYENSGGDAAWSAWFEFCSVARVAEHNAALAEGLRHQIEGAMKGKLARTGCNSSDFERDDPVSHFDAYFLLDSARKEAESQKPLKKALTWEMAENGIPLKQVVCGKLFSRAKGYLNNIVRDWIATVRGWKCHTIKQEDGTRKTLWEEYVPLEETEGHMDEPAYFAHLDLSSEEAATAVSNLFSSLEKELGLEKRKIALLLYVTANNGTLDYPTVLETLEVKKSRAYTMRAKCIEATARELEKSGIQSDDVKFAATLIASCETLLGDDLAETLFK